MLALCSWLKRSTRRTGCSFPSRPRFRPTVKLLESRDLLSGLAPAAPHVLRVRQGDPHAQYQTIQAAVNAAQPGDTIEIFSGTYTETASA